MLKDRKGVLGALAVVLAVGFAFELHRSSAGFAAAPGDAKQLVKWEYAELGRSGPDAGLRFRSTERTVEAETIEELSTKLGGKNERSWVALANAIGDQGWELVTVGPDQYKGGTFLVCIFKRQAK